MTQPIHPLADIEQALAKGPFPVVRDEDYVTVQCDPTGGEAVHVEVAENTFVVTAVVYDGRGGVASEVGLFESAASTEYVAFLVLDRIREEHAARAAHDDEIERSIEAHEATL